HLSTLHHLLCCSFFFYSSLHPRYLHSFPTRRSSDLLVSAPFRAAVTEAQLDPEEERASLTVAGFTSRPEVQRLNRNGIYIFVNRSEEHTSELQSRFDLVCRLLLEKKKHNQQRSTFYL